MRLLTIGLHFQFFAYSNYVKKNEKHGPIVDNLIKTLTHISCTRMNLQLSDFKNIEPLIELLKSHGPDTSPVVLERKIDACKRFIAEQTKLLQEADKLASPKREIACEKCLLCISNAELLNLCLVYQARRMKYGIDILTD